MLDPEYLLRVAEGAEDIAEQLHNAIIKEIVERIVIRLGRGDDYILTPRYKWQLEVLEDAGYILSDLQAEIATKTKMQRSEIREAFEDADVKNRAYDDAIYKAAGLPTSKRSPQMIRIMQRMYDATMGEWTNYCRSTVQTAQRLFIRECDNAYNLVVSGTMGYTEAVKRAVEAIASEGVTVTYPGGKTDTIETATLRAVRTGVSQTAAQITLQRARENGVDLVVTSSHLGARPTHEPWQGKVFHVDYDTAMYEKFRKRDSPPPTPKTTSDKYPDFVQSTRYGYVDGLCGANCRHSFYPYIEGVSHNPFEQFDSEENKKRYEAEQKQRAMERAIRKSKRKCEGLKTAVDNADEATRPAMQEAYGKAAAKLRQQNAEYKQFCEDNGLKTRQDRVSIAGWDRKQAAQARAAEKELIRKTKENNLVLKDKIDNGELSLKISPQKQSRHIEGTKEFELYLSQRTEKHQSPQSVLFMTLTEAQEFINAFHCMGTAEIKNTKNVDEFYEYITVEKVIGKYYDKDGYRDTKRVKVFYAKKNVHIVPVKNPEE